MKARLPKERKYFQFAQMDKAEKAMLHTWNSMRDDLKNGIFSYDNIDMSKQCTFLSVFDSLFIQNKGYKYFEIELNSLFLDFHIVRGTIIREGEPAPTYDRLLPKSEFITEDNRFSPKGVEWLYLAIGSPKSKDGLIRAKKCSQNECRASSGDKFAVCMFESNSSNNKIVDLTVGNQWTYDKLQKDLERAAKRIVHNEVEKYLVTFSNPSALDFIPEFQKWLVYTYSKMLSEQIFTPINTDDKNMVYAPFHCIAQYFLSLGYSGIVYKSTVYDKGKNLVLFDKNLVKPTGSIDTYTI